MKTLNVHDLHPNEDFLVSITLDNSSIGNVQETCHGELGNPLNIDAKVVHDDASITKMHLSILQKKKILWKPHYCTSLIRVFLKVNNNQPMDLQHDRIMKCIICHNDFIGLEILTMCTKCSKGLIA